jgi:predicted NUDIX family phosphoesterase
LGVVVLADAGGREVKVRETHKLSGAFASPAEVAAGADNLETWSRIVFDALETAGTTAAGRP